MRLKVGNEFLDQNGDTNIAQTISVSQFGRITDKNGSFSNKFKLPLTQKNKDLLGFPDNFNDNLRTPFKRFGIDLVDKGAVIDSGYLRLTIVDNQNEIQCTFFSGNTGWFAPLKEKSLRDLDLTEWSHTWNAATMKARIDSDPSEGYFYAPINYTYGGVQASFTLFDRYMFPGMFIHTLVSTIFNEIGWTIDGDFLELPTYKRMVLPFSDTDFTKPASEISTDEFEPWDAVSPLVTLTTYTLAVSAVTTFTPSSDGSYNIEARIVFDVTSVTAASTILTCKLNKLGVEQRRVTLTLLPGTTGDQVATINLEGEDIDVSAESFTVTVDVLISGSATIGIANQGGIFFYESSAYTIGDTISNMATTLPDIKQSDFIKYLFFSFGVVPQPNATTNHLELALFNTLKDNLPDAVDWSNKLDLSKSISQDFTQLLNDYGSISEIKYINDTSDSFLESYFNDNAKGFGDGQIDVDNEFIQEKKTIYQAPFAGFTNQYLFPDRVYAANIQFLDTTTDITGATRQTLTPKIGIMTPNEDVEQQTGGGAGYTVFTIQVFGGATPDQTCTDTPFVYFAKQQSIPLIDKYSDSLAYDQIEGVGYNDTTLKPSYLSDYESILSNMRYLKAYFRLTEVDINNLDFLKPVYIDRYKSYFYISVIKNYRGSNKTTQCELIKIT